MWQLGLENGEGKKGNSICKGSEARRAGLLEESPAWPRNSQGAEASGQSCGATEDSALRLWEAPEDLKEGGSAGEGVGLCKHLFRRLRADVTSPER